MKWKRKISGMSLLVAISSLSVAQSMNTGSTHNRGQYTKVADQKNTTNTNNSTTTEVTQSNPFQVAAKPMASATETSTKDTLTQKKSGVLYASNDVKPKVVVPVAKEQPKSTPTKNTPISKPYMPTNKYDPVPLGGELSYYKHNNDVMLAYIKGYFANFDKRLGSLQTPKKENILKSIDAVFDKHDIPRELKYLAVIESALNSGALSPVGARGYWQFMAPTGRMMGLRINGKIDERTDLTKSTHAAAKYLAYLYDEFDDWLLVVASYNSGPRPVINAIKKTGQSDFFAIKKYLPKETQNHVMAFIATATIMERMPHMTTEVLPPNYDWKILNVNRKAGAEEKKKPSGPLSKFTPEEISKMSIIKISKPIDLDNLCNVLGTERREIGKWNYDYLSFLSEYKAGNTYMLRIPKDKLDKYIENKQKIESVLLDLQQ